MSINTDNITVSVCMIAYKHEMFISEAIQSVLDQDTKFDIELVISDDCSPDNTEKLINQFILSHPKGSSIKYFRQKVNIGMESNFIFALQQCSGKYIALCEGDDYWISLNKLQMQVDELESDSNYIASFHNVKIVEGSNHERILYNKFDPEDFTIHNLANGEYMKTCSLVFRNLNGILDPLYNRFIPADDTSVGYCLLVNGLKARYQPYVMSVYRLHPGGIWSAVSYKKKILWTMGSLHKYLSFYNDTILKPALIKDYQYGIRSMIMYSIRNMDFSFFLKAMKFLLRVR